ncbi:MAG: 3'(2'),5'-bisphosphate nucleotidase CysQ [Trueperaceae bacterium]
MNHVGIDVQKVVQIAREAGEKILEIYETADFNVEMKADNSPLTKADIASHEHIVGRLQALSPEIPILSEESKDITYTERSKWTRFWLVDPLDGTKEFIKRNGEFTVNIALVENSTLVLGVVHTPALGVTYYAVKGEGAFKQDKDGTKPIQAQQTVNGTLQVVASRSHAGQETQDLLTALGKDYTVNLVSKGSALKLCLVAEGSAHLYPRLGPTMEWDTAAAQCVAEEAGAIVTDATGAKLLYNKENLLNPFFIVNGVPGLEWQRYLPKM